MTPTQFTAFANPLPDTLCLIDSTGQILASNPAAAHFFAMDRCTLSGKNLFDLVADKKDKLERTLRTWSSSRDAAPGAITVRTGSGNIIPCHGYGNLIQPKSDDAPTLIMLRIVPREKFIQSFTALNEKIALLQQEIMERRKTENALAYSKVQFEAVFNAIPDAVIFADTERRIVMNNPAVHTMFSYSDEELIGRTTEILYADKQSFAEQGRHRFHIGPETKTGAYEVQYRRKDGSTFWAETLGTQVNNREGEIIGFIGLLRDITERKRSQEAIRNIAAGVSAQTGEAFFQSLVKHLAKIFDIEYTFIGLLDEQQPDKVNTVALCAHGEVIDNLSYDLTHTPCDHVVGDCCSIQTYPDGIQRLFPDDPMLEEMGARSYIGAPLVDTAGKPIGLIVMMDNKPMESTEQVETILQIFAVRAAAELERLRTDKALRESQRMLELVLNSIPVRVFWKDHDCVYLGCNQHFSKDAGLKSPEQIIGKNDFELSWRKQAELYRADDQQVMQSGVPSLNYEESQTRPDGTQRWLQTSKVPLKDLSGNILGVMGVYGDITERKHAEDLLQKSEAQLRTLIDALPDLVWLKDPDGVYLDCNPKFERFFGANQSEIVGRTDYDFVDKELADFFRENDKAAMATGKPSLNEEEITYADDGHRAQLETIKTPVVSPNGKLIGVLGVGRDITERKRAEKGILESEKRLADAQRMAHIGNWELDQVTGNMEWSAEIYRIFEIDPRKFDASYNSFLNVIHPDDRERVKTVYAESVKNRAPYSIEHRLRMPGGTIKHVMERCETLYDEEGNPIRSVGTIQDITERASMEEALRRSQKMEAIGQLSGGIAHDFNNQLGVIIGYLDFLKHHFPESEKPRQWVDTATRATLRCMDLTRQLLAFSRRQSREQTVVDLNASIKEMETMIARSVTPEVEVEYSLAGDLWPTEIDPGELQDASLNLVINARDAMPYGGKLLIETTNRNLNAEYVALHPGVEAGDYVQLALSDTGSGMDKKVLEHIFEPFFTTKPEGKGTGLGMAMVYGFVKRNRGHIRVYSEPDVGTTVRIYLPRTTTSKTATPFSPAKMTGLPGGSESILIVDDEADLLTLADKYLSELGYRTRTAEHAAQALKILAGDQEFDLLFSDVVLPGGVNGYELAQQAIEQRPGLKVLLTSGYTTKAVAINGLARFSAHLLSKPYRKDDLAQRIRLVLDETSERVRDPRDAPDIKDKLTGRIVLVVDDEEGVRELIKLNLERLGCKTVPACNGDEAISLYQQSLESGEPIDVIILDLSIPGSLGGIEIADKVRALNPKAKMIVASGHSEGPEMTRYQDYGFQGALEKTFNREKIKQVLEQVFTSG